MQPGYNPRCVKGSEEAVKKAKITKQQLEDEEAAISESKFLESEERAAKNYWDAVIDW